ncbi:MAG: hypothetical protein ACHQ1D_06785 [Nitrososphaerales archaeon]
MNCVENKALFDLDTFGHRLQGQEKEKAKRFWRGYLSGLEKGTQFELGVGSSSKENSEAEKD